MRHRYGTMNVRRVLGLAVGGIALLGALPAARALPHPDEPIDPTKRAPISTDTAVRPGATPLRGDGVIDARVLPTTAVATSRNAGDGERAAIDVREAREKQVTRPAARVVATRSFSRRRAADLPASLPRLVPGHFQRMLDDYAAGRDPAAAGLATEVIIGGRRVNMADINRYASPRAALEAQGIPVSTAGGADHAEDAAPSTTVPIPAEKNGGPGAPGPAR